MIKNRSHKVKGIKYLQYRYIGINAIVKFSNANAIATI